MVIKQFSKTFLEILLIFWKIIIKDKYQPYFFVFYLFSHFADLASKKFFKNFGRLYLGQMWEMDAMEVTQGGPDTHDDPHQTVAVRTAARPLLVQKNHFWNYQMFPNFWLLYVCFPSHTNKFQLFSGIKHHTVWVSYFWLTSSCLKKIAKHLINTLQKHLWGTAFFKPQCPQTSCVSCWWCLSMITWNIDGVFILTYRGLKKRNYYEVLDF